MAFSLTATYFLPAILLNPILFLHSINTILSRVLPPIVAASTASSAAANPQQSTAPYSRLGPSANHPHLDVHTSDNLCWSYTALMVCAQLVAFDHVNQRRAKGKAIKENKKKSQEAAASGTGTGKGRLMNGKSNGNGNVEESVHMNGHCKQESPAGDMTGAENAGGHAERASSMDRTDQYASTDDAYDGSSLERTLTDTSEEMIL